MAGQFDVDPRQLVACRTLCHSACQWPSKAARANLPSESDDSHSNLGWQSEHNALVSRALDDAGRFQLGFCFSPPSLVWLVDNVEQGRLDLQNENEASVRDWVHVLLSDAAFQSTEHVVMPYELGEAANYADFSMLQQQTSALGAWFKVGQQGLDFLVKEFHGISNTTPSVRCWPHHFDVGTLFVLEGDDPETARSIGVGLSPGDDSFPEPYFYCSPYPAPAADSLPSAVAPLFWNTQGFVSLILKGSDIDESTDIDELLKTAMATVLSVG